MVTAGVLLSLAMAAPGRAATLRFCLDRANPMFSIDQTLARAVAAQQNRTAQFIVEDSSKADQDQESGAEQARYFANNAGKCDLFMGIPVEAKQPLLPPGMTATAPYAQTGFVVVSQSVPPVFPGVARDGKVGVVLLTVPSTYFSEASVAAEHVYDTNEQLYAALLRGEVTRALIWQPWLQQELSLRPRRLRIKALTLPHANWQMVALYPTADRQRPAVQAFNRGLTALAAGGKLKLIVFPYHVPVRGS
jgi:hypothetical protein